MTKIYIKKCYFWFRIQPFFKRPPKIYMINLSTSGSALEKLLTLKIDSEGAFKHYFNLVLLEIHRSRIEKKFFKIWYFFLRENFLLEKVMKFNSLYDREEKFVNRKARIKKKSLTFRFPGSCSKVLSLLWNLEISRKVNVFLTI